MSLLSVAPRFRITKNAQARNAYGAVAQEIACAVLGLDPIPINGNCEVCFDAEKSGRFFEIKSTRQSGGKIILYDWRMEKEKLTQVPLTYVIVCHEVKNSDGSRLLEEMLLSKPEILVLPAYHIHCLAFNYPLKQLKKPSLDPRNGYTRKGYSRGYRSLPLKVVKDLCSDWSAVSFSIYGMVSTAVVRTPEAVSDSRQPSNAKSAVESENPSTLGREI